MIEIALAVVLGILIFQNLLFFGGAFLGGIIYLFAVAFDEWTLMGFGLSSFAGAVIGQALQGYEKKQKKQKEAKIFAEEFKKQTGFDYKERKVGGDIEENLENENEPSAKVGPKENLFIMFLLGAILLMILIWHIING